MAVGDITACRIASAAAHNGFVAEIDITGLAVGGTYALGMGALNDPSAAKIVFTVTSDGFNDAGGATTIVRTVYGTRRVRKAAPDNALADEADVAGTLTVRVALSDCVYVGDTATVTIGAGFYTQGTASNVVTALAVTNNSTLAHPKVVGRWMRPGYERMTGDFVLEALCVHRSARNGKPVACVVFEATDGTNTVTSDPVTAVTVSTLLEGAGNAAMNKCVVYAATIPVASLTQGAVITCNFKAYPWVGGAAATLDSRTTADGVAQPDERLGPLVFLLDKTGGYGGAFAVVDATNGGVIDTADFVYATQTGVGSAEEAYTAATTNSYASIGNAAKAIRAFNNTTYGRNNPGGGTILISGVGTIDWVGSVPAANLGAQETYLTITKLSTIARSAAVITADSSTDDLECQRIRFFDVSFTGSGAVRIKGDDALVDVVWFDQCAINLPTSAAPFIAYHLGYATRNTVIALTAGFDGVAGTKAPFGLIRGNEGPAAAGPTGLTKIPGTKYCFVGNYNVQPAVQATGNSRGHAISDNTICAFNTAYAHDNTTVSWHSNSATDTVMAHGNAYIHNIVECQTNPGTWAFDADDEGAVTNHTILWFNVFTGARVGMGFNWTVLAAVLKTNYSQIGNLYVEYATKSDTTAPTPDGARNGNWQIVYHVGCWGNHRLDNAGQPDGFGEFSGLYTVDNGTWAFEDEASANTGLNGGSDAGNGDYHPTASSDAYDLMPGGVYSPFPYDLAGTARQVVTAGGSAGAFEMNPPAVAGGSVTGVAAWQGAIL